MLHTLETQTVDQFDTPVAVTQRTEDVPPIPEFRIIGSVSL